MKWCFGVALLLLGSVLCQNDIPEELQDIEKQITNIPGLENFNQSAIPSVEEVQDAIKQKCDKNGGPNAFDNVAAAKDEIQECIESNFNFTQIQEELAESRKTGAMEEVFAKYCAKTPIIQNCIKNLTLAVEPCLEEEEKESLTLILNITESLGNFGCYKEGDRIAMFVAEGGFECLQSKKDGLEQCANETLGHRITPDLSLTNLPLLVVNEESCDDYLKLQSCVVKVLETCDDNTPANIIDALFKFIRKITPCKSHSAPSSALQNLDARRVVRSTNQELNAFIRAIEQLKQKYEPHCLKYGGQKAADEFRDALTEVEKCQNIVQTKFIKRNEELKELSYDYMCKEYRLGLRECLVSLTGKIEQCSSPSEKYVPKFGLEIYDSIFKFHCKDDARALKKVVGQQDACMKKVFNSTDYCVGKTKHIRDYAKENVVTKSELCGDLKILRNCFVDIGAQQCPTNTNTNEFVVGFTDSIYAPCSGCKNIIDFLLLVTLLLFVKLS